MNAETTIEASAHEALRHFLQKLMDEHGLRVDSLRVEWTNTAMIDRQHYTVHHISMQTTK